MLSVRGRIYAKALGFMLGYDLATTREMIKPDKINETEKLLCLWPYVDEIRKLVNKHVIKSDTIKEEDIKTFGMLKYDSFMGCLFPLYYEKRNEYYNSIIKAMMEFHNNFVLKAKYIGKIPANKMFNNKVQFNELPYNDFLKEFTLFSCFFDALAMSQFVNLKSINEPNTPKDEMLQILEKHFSQKSNELDMATIKKQYYKMTSSQLRSLGYAINNTKDGIRVICPNDVDTLIIPAYVDGKEIYELTSITESLSNKTKARSLVILGNVNVISKFLTNAPYLSKIVIEGEVKEITDNSFENSCNLHKNSNGGLYLNINDNPYYALLSIEDDVTNLKINPKTVIVTYHAGYKKNVKSIDFSNVLSISRDAFYECGLISINLPNTLRNLGVNAFYGCKDARFLDLGYGIKKIPAFAFGGLKKVTELILHENIETIEVLAFSGLGSLEKLTICNDNIDIAVTAFKGSKSSFEIYGSDDAFIRFTKVSHVFDTFDCSWYDIDFDKLSKLKYSYEVLDLEVEELNEIGFDIAGNDETRSYVSANLPLKVKKFICPSICDGKPIEIVTYFFNKSSTIEKLYFPNDVYFEDEALYDCPNLEEIIVEGDVKNAKGSNFEYCEKLRTTYNGVEYININNNPYYIASKLADQHPKNIVLHPNCKIVQNYAFEESDIESLDFANVDIIGEGTIVNCEKLKKVTMSNSVKTILGSFLECCPNVEFLKLSDNIESIKGVLIYNNNKLREIKLPSKLICAESYLIDSVTELKEITFGKNTKNYEWDVVSNCPNLAKIRIPKGSEYDSYSFGEYKVEEY